MSDINRNTITNLDFLGEVSFETGFSFAETEVGGIAGITYDRDDNFDDAQETQFLTLARQSVVIIPLVGAGVPPVVPRDTASHIGTVEGAIDTETIPTVTPVTETPDEIRFGSAEDPDPDNAPDADDPAIYVHPEDPEQSFVITTLNGGLRVYDLAGEEIQSITPEDIRYNNVDIAYGVEYQSQLVGETATVDLAIASDRANDTLAIFAINPNGGGNSNGLPGSEILTDVTSINIPESIFGVDDGEATAYGLATYTSPVDGKTYVFVSQSDGNQIAQLELQPRFGAADALEVGAEVVRTFEVPIPEEIDLEDAQVEGIVVDRETGYLYVAQEQVGIWKFDAEPDVGANRPKGLASRLDSPLLVDTVTEDTDLSQVPFSNLVVFGDSLSDTGNVFNASEGLIPPSPPYADGRFSNGDLIVDAVAESLDFPESEPFLTGGSNYAFGGAQTGEGTSEFDLFGDLPETFDVPNLGQQVDLYLSSQTPTATDLFYVYGGGNDFIDPLLRGEALPTLEAIADNITTQISELAEAGAQTFVVPNLPLLGSIPLFNEQPKATAVLNNAIDEFNQLLDTELDAIAEELDVTIVEPDVNGISTEIQNNPADFGLTNTTDAVLDLTNLSLTGNPEEFFFWDDIHPTATATEIIAQEVIDVLPSGVTQFTGETPCLVPDVEGLTIYYGEDGGDDAFFLGTGDYVVGEEGSDQFSVADTELPDTAKRIADFELNSDVIGFSNLGIGFEDLTVTQDGDNSLITVADNNVAVLTDVDSDSLSADNFAFV